MPKAAVLGALWLLAALPATAHVGFTLEPARARYHAIERFDNGATANSETGALDGGRGTLWWDAGSWRAGVSASRLAGSIAYAGRSQIGLPVRTTTHLGIDEAALDAGWSLGTQGDLSAGVTGALGVRRVDRAIAPSLFSTPLTEVLHWRFAQLGAQARWAFAPGWFALASAGIEHGLGARLAVDFHGVADPVRLSPGHGGLGHRFDLGLGHEIAPGVTFGLRAGTARQRYGGSPAEPYRRNGQVVGQASYPGSTQRQTDLQLVLTMEWR